MLKKILSYFVGFVLIVSLCLYVYRAIALSQIPVEDADLGTEVVDIILPERPGTRSLVLTGPLIKPLVFAVNMRTPGIKSLDWDALINVDFTADVRVTARVEPDGSLEFDPIDDVYCPGHAKAGEMVSNVLKSWKYTPYKTGILTIRFNVGAVGKRMTVDVSQLQRREGVDPDIPLKNGKLYLVKGSLKSSEVRIKSW